MQIAMESTEQYTNESELQVATCPETGMILQLADGTIVACSETAQELLGMTITQLQDASSTNRPWQTIHPDGTDFPGETHPAMVALQTGQPCCNVVMGFYQPDGELVWLNVDAHPLFRAGDTHPYAVTVSITRLSAAVAVQNDIVVQETTERKQLEAEREQAKTERDHFFDLSTDLLMIGDLTGRFFQISPAWTRTLGWSETELTTRSYLEFVHPDDLAKTQQEIQRMNGGGTKIEFENRYRCRDGSYRWLFWNVVVTENNRVYGVVRDMSDRLRYEGDRRRMEAELRESEAQLRLFVKYAPAGVAMFDREMRYIAASDYWLTSYGLKPQEVVGRSHYELFPDISQRWKEIHQRCLAGAIERCDEDPFPRADGLIDWVRWEIHPWCNKDDEIGGIIIFSKVITDLKHNEQRLRESEERLQLGVQVAGVAIARFDYASNTVTLSPEAAALYGIPADELVVTRDRIHSTFHPDEREMMEQIIAQVLNPAGEGWFAREHRVVWQTGEVRWLNVRKQVFFDRSGEVPRPGYAILAAVDITERKQGEAEREQLLIETQAAREEAEVVNRSKDEFVAVVAHELRSPLNSIAGWSKLLQTRKFDEATLSKALDTIWRNTQTQVQLVEDLLDISRMVRGTLQINFAPVNWVNVIEATLEIVRPMADAKQIQLETNLTLTPQISGDFHRLQQIAVNLLTNAIKFTPNGGQVQVDLEQVDAQVLLRVRDTGKGIAPEFLPEIFERYKQGQKNTGSKDGLGLGLAIVKNLVELHHGTIRAESAGIGAGTTFTVCLPQLQTLIAEREPVIIDTETLAGIRVLAVDDEPDMLNLITFVLQDYGAEVKAVESMTAALACVSEVKPDILLSDISMPGGDGYELVQQIKSYPEGRIPAIALTAYASATHREQSRLAGFDQHLTKPVEPETLVATILRLVAGETS